MPNEEVKKVREKVEKKLPNEKKLFSIIVATFVRWCGLIPRRFPFFNLKKKKT